MAVDTNKSTAITNATATPPTKTPSHLYRGQMFEVSGTCTCTAAAEADSTYRFCRVPSTARVSQVLISCAAFTTAGTVNVGVWQTADNGGAVVDADLFASEYDLNSSTNVPPSDITFESGEYTYVEAEKALWEVLGLSADPERDYDIVAQTVTAFDGGQTMHLKVIYCE